MDKKGIPPWNFLQNHGHHTQFFWKKHPIPPTEFSSRVQNCSRLIWQTWVFAKICWSERFNDKVDFGLCRENNWLNKHSFYFHSWHFQFYRLLWFIIIMIYCDLIWFIIILIYYYFDLLLFWFIIILIFNYLDLLLLWFITIYYDLLCFIMIYYYYRLQSQSFSQFVVYCSDGLQ